MPKNPHANFRPTIESYSGQGAFRFWCQMALPLTFDDSLSYYELLNKVVTYLNNTIEDVGKVEENVAALNEAYGKLEDYVNTYFDEIDIEDELRNILDAMAEDGSLDSLLDPLVAARLGDVVAEQISGVVANQIDNAVEEQIGGAVANNLPAVVPNAVSNWLEENITPTTPAIDKTLTISDAAADAKVAGDEITDLKNAIISLFAKDAEIITPTSEQRANLNDYTTPGTYKVISTDLLQYIDNGPLTNVGYRLIVMQLTNSLRIAQIAIKYSADGGEPIFVRIKNNNTWGKWYKIITDESVLSMFKIPVVDTVAMLRQTTYPVGTFIRTMGFNTVSDYGDALYCVHSSGESYTVNNVTIFNDANNNYVVRVFDKPYIYLESLNVENVAWNVIDDIIVQSGIKDVRANILHMDHSIAISQYDFTFNEIHSSGDPALRLNDANTRKIVGKAIYATYRASATGFLVQNTDSNILKNYIDIRRIEATGVCASIRPTNGHGILENEYHFGVLQGRKYNAVPSNPIYGLNISIQAVKSNNEYVLDDDGYPLNSYEGEDQYWIDIISVKNDSGNGVGVNINIAVSDRNFSDSTIDTNTSVFGTVTGLTFHNLSVEECNIGVRMRCGTGNPTESLRTQSGIKSVRIHNMRVREGGVRYFDIVGWLRDIYIQPTSKINLSQVGTAVAGGNVAGIGYNAENDTYKFPIINASQEYVIIDAPVFNGIFDDAYSGHYGNGIGEQLIATNNQMYIGKRIPLEIAVTSQENIEDSTISPAIVEYDAVANEYVLRQFFKNHFPCAERFVILDDLSGNAETPKTVVLDLREYYYQNSAVGIKVSVPAYCVCYIRLITGDKMKVCNANAVRKNYTFSQLYSRTSTLTAKPYIVEESIIVT